jgi:glucokinase
MAPAKMVAGVDIGGTNVRAAMFDTSGKMLGHLGLPIEAAQGPASGLARITRLIEDVSKGFPGCELAGIGVGSTGPLDRDRGTIENPYTLPGWENVNIVSALSTAFAVPVALENDADAAALGEYWQGAGQGVSRLLALTVGTGVGTAIILDGGVYRGWKGLHGEGGHHVVDPSGPACYCGAHGCLESLVSGPAIARLAQEKAAGETATLLRDRAGASLENIDGRMVSDAARDGDAVARAVIDQVATYLAIGLLNMINFFVPEVIVLSGSVMRDYDLFEPTIRTYLDRCSVLAPSNHIQIALARLGDHAGVFGAAYAILHDLS